MTDVAANLALVRKRIEGAGGDPATVKVVAVTKGFDAAVVRQALDAGLQDLGESYVQELTAKDAAIEGPDRPRWHFVGRLQRNKVRKASPLVGLWQSVDRASLGAEIARHAPGAAVLVQVNLTGEEAKGGCPPDELPGLVHGLREGGLAVQGLMTVGPQGPAEMARPAFRELARWADRLELPERSMGMSNDLEVAVQEGATMVRVGSAVFGPRPGSTGVKH